MGEVLGAAVALAGRRRRRVGVRGWAARYRDHFQPHGSSGATGFDLPRWRRPTSTRSGTVGYGSFLVVVTLALVGVMFAQVQAFAALDGSPDTVRTLHEARYVVVNLSAVPTIVSATTFAIVMVRTGFPTRWLGWGSAEVAALAHVPAAFALSQSGALWPAGWPRAAGPDRLSRCCVRGVDYALLVGRGTPA